MTDPTIMNPSIDGAAGEREAFRSAMVDAARARGGAGAEFIAKGESNLWLDIAFDAFTRLSQAPATEAGEVERLQHKMMMIVSHATGGTSQDIDASINDICCEISRNRNVVFAHGQEVGAREALSTLSPASVGAGKPVAWMFRRNDGQNHFVEKIKWRADQLDGGTGPLSYTETPLYASPATPTEQAEQGGAAAQLLCGMWEAAELFGMTKQGVHLRIKAGKFPKPVVRLRMGPVWKTSDLLAALRQPAREGEG